MTLPVWERSAPLGTRSATEIMADVEALHAARAEKAAIDRGGFPAPERYAAPTRDLPRAAVVIAEGVADPEVRRITELLEGTPVEVMLVPRLLDVPGQRMSFTTAAGLNLVHVALPPDIDEEPRRGELPRPYCARLAAEKAAAVAAGPEDVVLCADTTVALGRRILGQFTGRGAAL